MAQAHRLGQSLHVCGASQEGRALLNLALALKPDVVLVDIAMPLMNGLDAGRQLKEKAPGIRIVYLTVNEDPDLAAEAMRAGASGYMLKKCATSELLHALREVLRGRSYVTPQVARGMQEAFIRDPRPKERHKDLTPRQREVIQTLAEGKSMKEAADVLKVSTSPENSRIWRHESLFVVKKLCQKVLKPQERLSLD